jgi:MoaD family protein
VVRVRLFAVLRELAGASSIDLEAGAETVGDAIEELGRRFGPKFTEIARSGSAVIDGERAMADRPLAGARELALLPPVSGGRGR